MLFKIDVLLIKSDKLLSEEKIKLMINKKYNNNKILASSFFIQEKLFVL